MKFRITDEHTAEVRFTATRDTFRSRIAAAERQWADEHGSRVVVLQVRTTAYVLEDREGSEVWFAIHPLLDDRPDVMRQTTVRTDTLPRPEEVVELYDRAAVSESTWTRQGLGLKNLANWSRDSS